MVNGEFLGEGNLLILSEFFSRFIHHSQLTIHPSLSRKSKNPNKSKKLMKIPSQPLLLRRQVLHDQLLLNLPRAGMQQG